MAGAAMLKDGTADRGRLGDIVHARYLYWELGDRLPATLQPYGIDISDFFTKGKEWMTALLDDIPNAAINITLADKGFRNSYKKWTGNDIRDADAVSAAIPHCDVAMTDNYVAAQFGEVACGRPARDARVEPPERSQRHASRPERFSRHGNGVGHGLYALATR